MPTEQAPQTAQVPSAPVGYEDRMAQAKAKAMDAGLIKPVPAPDPAPVKPTVSTEPVRTDPGQDPTGTPTDPSLRRLTQLTRQVKDFQDKIKAYEAQAPTGADQADATLLREVRDLYKSGKRVEAVAKLAGNADATAEMQELLASYLGQPVTADPASPDKAAPNPLEETVRALQERLDKADKADADQAEQARLKAAQDRAGELLDELKNPDGTAKHQFCSMPRNRAEAYDLALSAAAILVEADGVPADQALTPDEIKRYMALAYAEVETEFERDAEERYGFKKGQAQAQAATGVPAGPANNRTGNQPVTDSKSPDSHPSRMTPRVDTHFRAAINTQTTDVAPGHRHPDEAIKRIREAYRTGQ